LPSQCHVPAIYYRNVGKVNKNPGKTDPGGHALWTGGLCVTCVTLPNLGGLGGV
jgi:hypothetical protein